MSEYAHLIFDRVGHRMLVVLAVLLICALAAPISLAAEKITFIGVWVNWGPELQRALDKYTAQTGVQVELIQTTGWPDMMAKIKTMAAGGVAPDLIYGDNLRIMELAELGMLLPLDDMAKTGGVNVSTYPAVVLEGLRVKGKLYSLPTAVSNYAVYYNVDLFDQVGLPMLPTSWTSNLLTWTDWVGNAKKLTQDKNGDGTPEQFAMAGFGYQGGFNMLGMWNATDIDQDRTKYLGTNPSVIRALEYTASLWTEHNVVGGNYLTGTAAIMPSQPVYLNNLLQAANKGSLFTWSLGVLPKGDVRCSQTGFHSLGVSAQSKLTAETWRLAKYLAYEQEGNLLFTRAENRVPVLREAGRDYVRRWNELFPKGNTQVLVDAIPVLWDWRIISGKGGSAILTLETEAFGYIRNKQKSVREALEFIAPRMQAALQ